MTSILPDSAQLKLELMFHGLRYSTALGNAAENAYPNFYPYRFQDGEPNPTGKSQVPIPYLFTTQDGTLVRVKGNGRSEWSVDGDFPDYKLKNNATQSGLDIQFEPLPQWMTRTTSDGFPMAKAGVSLHGDMAVINVAPGCEYFLAKKQHGKSMRCKFCSYGAPDNRTAELGQVAGETHLPALTYERMREALAAATSETQINHIYLVGGSLQDWEQEGLRFIEIAREVQKLNQHNIPVTCGSGALPDAILRQLHNEKLVDNICFNLEVWSEKLFAQVCPGKNEFVGYQRWIDALETAVGYWGKGHVYSAMVAGIELEPEYEMSWEQAVDLAVEGADDLCSRDIIPIYSLYWPVGGRDHPDYLHRLKSFFENLNLRYAEIRRQYDLNIWDGFMCHQCAYMQLECDIDRHAHSEKQVEAID